MANPFAKYAPPPAIGPDQYKVNDEKRKETASQLAQQAADRAAAQAEEANANAAKARDLAERKFAAELAEKGLMIGPDGQVVKRPGGSVTKAMANDPQRLAQINSLLDVIDRTRAQADDFLAVGEQSKRVREWPLVGGFLGQNRADVEGLAKSIEGDLIQQQIARLSAMNGGNGVASIANSEQEAARMASAIANLSLDQSPEEFRAGLDRAEQYYRRQLADMQPSPEQQNQDIMANIKRGQDYANDGTGIKTGNNGFDKYVTEEDRKRTNTLQALYENPNTSPEQLNAAAAGLGLQPFAEEDLRVLFDAKAKGERVRLSPNPTGERGLGQQFLGAVADSAAGAYGGAALDAATLGFSDELVGMAYGDRAGQLAQYGKEYARNESPWASLAGDVTGGVMLGGPAAAGVRMAGIKGVQAASPFAARLANTFAGSVPRAAITASTAQGALTGAGQMNDNRALGALIGGGAGAAGSLAGVGLASLPYTATATNLTNPIRGMFGGRQRPALPSLSPAQQLMNRSVSGNFDNAISQMDEAGNFGLPMTLADADPALRSLAGSAVRKSPDARGIAEDVLMPRQRGQYDRLIQAFNRDLGDTANIPERSAQLIQKARDDARPLYQPLEQMPPRTSPALDEMLNTNTGMKAMRNATEIADADQVPAGVMNIGTDAQGNPVFDATPNFNTLNYVKQGFDRSLEAYRNPMTGALDVTADPLARATDGLRSRFVSEMDQLYPGYAEARAAYAGPAGERQAFEQGVKSRSVSPDVEQFNLAKMTEPKRQQYAIGRLSDMAEQAGQIRYSQNPWEAIVGSPNQTQRIGNLFPEGAPRFNRQYGLESEMAQTNKAVIGGSPTAERQAADANFDIGFLPTAAMDVATTGTPMMTTARLGAKFAGDELGRIGAKKKADALAPILFNADPAQNAAFIRELQKTIKVQKKGKGMFGNRAKKLGALAGGSPSVGFTLGLTE